MRTVMTAVLCRFRSCANNSLPVLFAVAAIFAVLVLASPQPAQAFSDEELRNVTEQLNDKSSTKKLEAIEATTADGDPRADPERNA